MEVFRGASGIRIRRANFSNVGRDQINYTTTHIHNTIIHGGQGRLARRANALELSEYTEVKRGDIDKIWDIYYTKQHKSRTKGVEEDIYIAEITMDHSTGHTRKLTVQTFYGPLAKKRWSREYSKFSRDRNVRLFGYNKSSIPSLIFHGELVPLAHFQDRLGMLGRFYTLFLLGSLHCAQNELWFNPTNGKMCRGPAGPPSPKLYHLDISHFDVTVPPTIDVFEDNMITRYFACSRLGVLLFAAISLATHSQRMGYITEPHVVRAVSDLTHSTIAVSQEAQWRSFQDNLDFIQVMPNGTTRLRLSDAHRRLFLLCTAGGAPAWLSQAPSIFHAHGISLDDDLSRYRFMFYHISLAGTLSASRVKRLRRQLFPPIHIFLRPPPPFFRREGSSTALLHIWSLDENGETALSHDMCRYLGLPFKLELLLFSFEKSWSSSIYKTIHEYQTTLGYDPKTTEYARSLGHSAMEIVLAQESRFQEVNEEENEIRREPEGSSSMLDNMQGTLGGLAEANTVAIPDVSLDQAEAVPASEILDDSFSLALLFGGGEDDYECLVSSPCSMDSSEDIRDHGTWPLRDAIEILNRVPVTTKRKFGDCQEDGLDDLDGGPARKKRKLNRCGDAFLVFSFSRMRIHDIRDF